jgi:large conductance mechanosensitive channel
MLKEFREFALKGNVVDMAVGIIIGAAFGTIVKSLVDDVIMPPIGLMLGGVDFASFFVLLKEGSPAAPYASLAEARAAGAVTVNYGVFINAVISFLVVALVIFFLIRMMNRLRRGGRGAWRTHDEGLPVLPVHDSHQGHALRALHVAAGGDWLRGLGRLARPPVVTAPDGSPALRMEKPARPGWVNLVWVTVGS